MALILALREGHDFYVEDTRFVVSKVVSAYECEVTTPYAAFRISADMGGKVKVSQGVYLSVSTPEYMGGNVVRVAVDAKGKLILRGDLYRKRSLFPGLKEVCETCKGKGLIKVPAHQYPIAGEAAQYQDIQCPDCPD